MPWNYRVVRRVYKGDELPTLAIHEAYYDADGKPDRITSKAMAVWADDNVGELHDTLVAMLHALDQPVLEYSDFLTEDGDDKADSE